MGCGDGADKPAGGEDPVPAVLARASSAQVGALGEETGVINTGARQHGGKLNLSARVNVVMVEVSQEVEMTALLVVGLVAGTPLFALGLNDLQASLERWDQQRHAED